MHRRRLVPISRTEAETSELSRLDHVNALNNIINSLPIRPGCQNNTRSTESDYEVSNISNRFSGQNNLPTLRTKTKTRGRSKNEIQRPTETPKNTGSRRLIYRNFNGLGKNSDCCKIPPLCRMLSISPHLLIKPEMLLCTQICSPEIKNNSSRRPSVSPFSSIVRTPIRSPELPTGLTRTGESVLPQIQNDLSRSVSPSSPIARIHIRSPELPIGFVRTSESVLSRIRKDFSRFPSFVQMIWM